MAKIASILSTKFIIFFLIVSITAEKDDSFARTLDRKLFGLKKEKLSHFRFYWHDVVGGKNPTAVQIIAPVSNTSTTAFGMVRMIDNPLTEGPDLRSKLWGKAQGFYASASQTPGEFDLLMAMNFAFVSGKYNGSTLTILGRNSVLKKVREMPVIGGSGLFRFARGYAEARTTKLDVYTGDAVIEYNLYVLHY